MISNPRVWSRCDQMQLRIDPEFSELIPPLSESEYEYLEDNIRKEGCLNPIIVWKNTIIDGHNRYRICKKWDIPFEIEERTYYICHMSYHC